ncbi:RNA methyltransferase substrate-binding domain-containing protein, partial [Arthrospira platensis SPKY1]|nr:RNA methyltransferase substrate-binding domain-containing protein [Arthrospira platensis SPKY1]
QRRDARLRDLLDAAAETIPIHFVERAELDRLSGGARHQGVVARLEVRRRGLDEADLPGLLDAAVGPALLLVLDGVQDPHNLGACLRGAAAAGVHAVIAPADRAVGL